MRANRFRRRKSIQEFHEQQPFDNEKQNNVIQQTRRMVLKMNEQERFKKAKRHLEDALAYRNPRPDTYNQNLSFLFQKTYQIQSSKAWGWLMFLIGYVYMYLVILDSPNLKGLKMFLQIIFLATFWLDAVMEAYHITQSPNPFIAKLPNLFYGKMVILALLTIDMLIYWISLAAFNPSRPIRPFRILRAAIPLFYDSFIRKSFQALFSCYKDIIVYLMFYAMVIVGFAIVGNQIIQIPAGTQFDNYKENYIDLQKIIFVIYVMSSYDSYPDNQIIAVRANVYNYAFFIVFVFFNVFFFVVIPATIIFNSFRETRSRIMLVDQIKQKHSLILSFVSLGEQKFSISHKKLIKFLLYIYKGKVRYIDHITQVCLKLDRHNNGFIQVNQYMQLCRVLQQNSSVMPPNFHDIKIWIKLRRSMNERFKLSKLINSEGFRVLNTLFILATFVNCCLYLATGEYTFALLDNMFMGIFILQVTLKMIGFGVENYFQDKWNTLDFGLILTGLIIQIIPKQYQPHNSDVLFKMTRIFRVTTLLKIIFRVRTTQKHNSIFRKIRQLLGQMTIIVPIILKFFPLFMITYYVLGIIGMQAYYGEAKIKPQNSPYSFYNEFSNFKSFMATQFIMVQVLVQAGWSLVAFDHAYRFGQYLFTMLYFVGIHMITVLILSALMKGLVWQVYFTVNQEYQERLHQQQAYDIEQQKLKIMGQQVEAIKVQVQENLQLTPDTIIKKELVENRLDLEIMANIKSKYVQRITSKKELFKQRQQVSESRNGVDGQGLRQIQATKVSRKSIISQIIKDRKIRLEDLSISGFVKQGESKSTLQAIIQRDYIDYIIDETNPMSENSLDDKMEKILTSLILNPSVTYSQTIIYPQLFMEFLNFKLEILWIFFRLIKRQVLIKANKAKDVLVLLNIR